MLFYFQLIRYHLYLHSFPTRRSSDLVVRIDVQHRRRQALGRQVAQADRGEGLAQAAALGAGADSEYVDLAQALLGVHLRPVEADQPALLLRQEEALRVEPRLALAVVQVALGQRALL